MQDVSAPDYYGPPIKAWRTWYVVPADKTSGELRLRSFVHTDLWEQGEPFEAQCRLKTEPHDAPDDIHGCGVYAAREPKELDKYYRNPAYSSGSWMEIWRVIGEVGLWGKIVPAEKGFRAQYAYPIRLQVPMRIKGRDLHLSAKEVAIALEHYSCEVELVDDTLDLDKEHSRYRQMQTYYQL